MAFQKKTKAGKTDSKASKKPAAKKKAKVTFQAPSDFKPCFIELTFRVGADSLAHPKFKIERVKGKWDNPDNKRFNMLEYDAQTALALTGRLFGRMFVVNPAKRIPANSSYKLIIRVNRKSKDNTIGASVKEVAHLVKKEGKKAKWVWFSDKKDPVFRKIRSANRFLAGAFTDIQLPPSGKRAKAQSED